MYYPTYSVIKSGVALDVMGFDTPLIGEYSHQLSATHRWDGGHFAFLEQKGRSWTY